MSTDTVTLYADTKTCAILKAYTDLCTFHETNDDSTITLRYGEYERVFTTPVRLGEILDRITSYRNTNKTADFEDGVLDLHHGIFTRNTGEAISLTEKEVEILSFLHKHKESIIARDDLLHAVWNYAQNVETHTLETHIYRLRQKIEENPAHPTILITEENGYRVL